MQTFSYDYIEIIMDSDFEKMIDWEKDEDIEKLLSEFEREVLNEILKDFPQLDLEDIKYFRIWLDEALPSHSHTILVNFLVVKIKGEYYLVCEENCSSLYQYENVIQKVIGKIKWFDNEEIENKELYRKAFEKIFEKALAVRIIYKNLYRI